MILQTSISPTETNSLIKTYSSATNEHRRGLLIITLIIAIVVSISLILLCSTTFQGATGRQFMLLQQAKLILGKKYHC